MLRISYLQELIELMKGDTDDVKDALAYLVDRPLGDMRLLPHLEELLEDRRPCILYVPYRYGELRWLAAEALVAEREKLSIDEPVILRGVVKPLSIGELKDLAKNADIDMSLSAFDTLKKLIQLDKVPVQNRAFWPHTNE
jgi:hypothetical protein